MSEGDQVEAVEVTLTAPITSFRNPLYAAVQVGLPCPPPSTVAGLLASMVGGWDAMPRTTRFAMAFTAAGHGTDLETYHPLEAKGARTAPAPRDREFLADTVLTVWLTQDLDLWEQAVRRPVWPLRLGRSQDLASARAHRTTLTAAPGVQGHALVPEEDSIAGTRLRLPTAISRERTRTTWGGYRYAASGSTCTLDTGYRTPQGRAAVLLAPAHPDLISGAGP